ncbi:hypothetical protein HRbin24_00145 [bacterium HR24]|nr:hypothetical protein HRbin24_00145 [bacterium HR24]
MRTVVTSGGVELGPPEGPWIDIVPLALGAPRGEALVGLADELVAAGGQWQEWQGTPGAPAPPELVGVSGVVPGLGRPELLVMFRRWGRQDPLSALRAVEEHEGVLPLRLACACLLAARAERRPGRAPALAARAAPELVGVDAHAAPMGRDELATACAEAAARGDQRPTAPSTSAAAQALLRLARLLWRQETAGRLRRLWRPGGRWEALADLAAAAAMAWGIERAAGPMGAVAVPAGTEGHAWAVYAEAVGTGLSRPGLRHLLGEGEKAPPGGAQISLVHMDPDAGLAMARSLLEEARGRARYAVEGALRVLPPREVAALGLRELRLWAEGGAVWAAIAGREGLLGPFRWEPAPDWDGSPLIPRRLLPLVHLLLAAAYRDLTVAGEAGMPRRRREEGGTAAASGVAASRAAGTATGRPLPAPPRRGTLAQGTRLWASPRERATVRRAAAMVRGHLRRLPPGWSPSADALAAAASYGVPVPPGHTFVRPHARGGPGEDASPVTARGLMAVMALLPQDAAIGRTAS